MSVSLGNDCDVRFTNNNAAWQPTQQLITMTAAAAATSRSSTTITNTTIVEVAVGRQKQKS